MEIPPKDPWINPPNHFQTFDQLHPGWYHSKMRFKVAQLRDLYQLLALPTECIVPEKGRKVSSEEAFILTAVKLAEGYEQTWTLAKHFGFSSDALVYRIYELQA